MGQQNSALFPRTMIPSHHLSGINNRPHTFIQHACRWSVVCDWPLLTWLASPALTIRPG